MCKKTIVNDNNKIETVVSKINNVINRPLLRRHQHHRRQPKVRFQENDDHDSSSSSSAVSSSSSSSSSLHTTAVGTTTTTTALLLTDEICSKLWYSEMEINQFQCEIRNIALFGKQFQSNQTDDDVVLDGLERFTIKRSQRKRFSIKCILLAQSKYGYNDCNKISRVSKECSTWAVNKGLEQGLYDYCDVYDPFLNLLGDNCNNNNNNNKGSESDEGEKRIIINYNEILFGTTGTSCCEDSTATTHHHHNIEDTTCDNNDDELTTTSSKNKKKKRRRTIVESSLEPLVEVCSMVEDDRTSIRQVKKQKV